MYFDILSLSNFILQFSKLSFIQIRWTKTYQNICCISHLVHSSLFSWQSYGLTKRAEIIQPQHAWLTNSIRNHFHQRFFVRNFGAKNYKVVFWVLNFLAPKYWHKMRVKCWWNRPQVSYFIQQRAMPTPLLLFHSSTLWRERDFINRNKERERCKIRTETTIQSVSCGFRLTKKLDYFKRIFYASLAVVKLAWGKNQTDKIHSMKRSVHIWDLGNKINFAMLVWF